MTQSINYLPGLSVPVYYTPLYIILIISILFRWYPPNERTVNLDEKEKERKKNKHNIFIYSPFNN